MPIALTSGDGAMTAPTTKLARAAYFHCLTRNGYRAKRFMGTLLCREILPRRISFMHSHSKLAHYRTCLRIDSSGVCRWNDPEDVKRAARYRGTQTEASLVFLPDPPQAPHPTQRGGRRSACSRCGN